MRDWHNSASSFDPKIPRKMWFVFVGAWHWWSYDTSFYPAYTSECSMTCRPHLILPLGIPHLRNTRQSQSGSMPSLDTHNNNLRNVSAATETFSGHTRRLSRCKSDSEMIRQVYGSNSCLSTRLIAARSLSSKCTSPEENLCLDKSTPHTWSTFTMFVAGYVRTVSPKFTSWYTT